MFVPDSGFARNGTGVPTRGGIRLPLSSPFFGQQQERGSAAEPCASAESEHPGRLYRAADMSTSRSAAAGSAEGSRAPPSELAGAGMTDGNGNAGDGDEWLGALVVQVAALGTSYNEFGVVPRLIVLPENTSWESGAI